MIRVIECGILCMWSGVVSFINCKGDKLFKFLFYCECGFKFEVMFCIC